MNWDAIGAAGEWAGAIAVVITLVYLARQIQQQNKIAKFSGAQSVWDGFREILLAQAYSAEITELWLRGSTEPGSLSEIEASQFFSTFRAYFTGVNKALRAYELGFLDSHEWHDIAIEFLANTKSPGGMVFREAAKDFGFEEFWKAIDAVDNENVRMPDYNSAKVEQKKADSSEGKT